LLRDAEQAGCTTVSGIEMFLNQAAVQFTLWTGQPAPAEVMRAVLEKHFT
jgi:shikimate dehydrogenase